MKSVCCLLLKEHTPLCALCTVCVNLAVAAKPAVCEKRAAVYFTRTVCEHLLSIIVHYRALSWIIVDYRALSCIIVHYLALTVLDVLLL